MKLNHCPLNWTVASSPAQNSTFAVTVYLLEIPLSTPVPTLLTPWRSTLRSRMPLWLAQSLARNKNLVGLTAKNFLKTEGGDLVQLVAVPYETSGETRLRGWPKFMAKLWLINSWSLRDTDHYIQVKNLYILTRRESILMWNLMKYNGDTALDEWQAVIKK